MTQPVDFYLNQAQASRDPTASPWLLALQQEAFADLQRLRFPDHQEEAWKYTRLDSFWEIPFVAPSAPLLNPLISKPKSFPFQSSVLLDNAHAVITPLLEKKYPKGVIIAPLMQALSTHEALVKPHLGKIAVHEHGFQAFNTAAFDNGVLIFIPKNVCLEEPLVLNHWQDEENTGLQVRHLIVMEEGSKAEIIHYCAGQEVRYFTNVVTEIALSAHAQLTHYLLQQAAETAIHFTHTAVNQAAYSQFNHHVFNLGGKLARSDLKTSLQEQHAACALNGIYLPKNTQHMDHHTLIRHEVPHCTSYQNYKGILNHKSRAVFSGKIVVAPYATDTDAQQQNKNILLSPQAEVNTQPQLEIFTDEVRCTHGATVGQLDEDALFYLLSRGIPRSEAVCYLIQAFAADNLQSIPQKLVSGWITQLISEQLK